MSDSEARNTVLNILDRLEQEGRKFLLPGGILTSREVLALRELAGSEEEEQRGEASISPDSITWPLNVDCISAPCDEDKVLCIDFGTAFSKAAVWDQWGEAPAPLPIGRGQSADPLLIDSVVYIGASKVFFGPRAIREFGAEGDDSRAIFSSPKEILNLDYDTIQTDRPSSAVDPGKSFRKKDLLVLFLGFLTAITMRELSVLEISTQVKRRFAAPGWGDAQQNVGGERFDGLAIQMRRFLAEAQILADSFPIGDWIDGIDIAKAKSAIAQLGALSDEQLLTASFIDRPVLEVTAAASSIKEKLLNKRPQVVVVDVGAGTTDIGVFKYVGSEDEPKFAAYKNGLAALDMAGNRLDDAFKAAVRKSMDLGEASTAMPKLERELTQNIHRYKRELFEKGSVSVAISGLPEVVIKQSSFVETPIVKNFQKQVKEKVIKLLNFADGADGVSFVDISSENYVVFTGGGAGLEFLHDIFADGLDLLCGRAHFQRIEPRPTWLEAAPEEQKAVFAQISVAVGGASPDLPLVMPTVGDTSKAASRTLSPLYKS